MSVGNGTIATAAASGGVRESRDTRRGRPVQRQKLFSAARHVLATKSIFDATVSDIVREAGVAQGTFYIYFADKFDLLRCLAGELVEQQVLDVRAERARHADRLERLEHYLLVAIRRWQEHAPVYRAVFQLAMLREDFHELRDQLQVPLREERAADISYEQGSGVARQDVEPRLAAVAFQRMYELICMEWFGCGTPPYAGANAETIARDLARIWYHVVYPDEPAREDSAASAPQLVDVSVGRPVAADVRRNGA